MEYGMQPVRSLGRIVGEAKCIKSATLDELVHNFGAEQVVEWSIKAWNTARSNPSRTKAIAAMKKLKEMQSTLKARVAKLVDKDEFDSAKELSTRITEAWDTSTIEELYDEVIG